jgi:hypothetical protein
MFIVSYWDHDPIIGSFLNHRKFDDKKNAKDFCKKVDGSMEIKLAFQ